MVSFVGNTRLTFVSPVPTSAIPLFRTLSETQFPLSPLSPIACRLLNSLASLFRAPVLCFQCFAASFSKTPGVGVSPSLNRGFKMTHKSPSSDFTPERCQYRTATGRQCCSLAVDPDNSFCARHAASEPSDSEDFSVALTQKACRFQNAQGINHSLGSLYTLCAQALISPRRATTLAYISSLLLRTLPAIDADLYPHAGRPGFNPSGDPPSENDIDATDQARPSEAPTQSHKPN